MFISSDSTGKGLGKATHSLWVRTLMPLRSIFSLTWTSTTHKIIGGRHPTVDIGLQEQMSLATYLDQDTQDVAFWQAWDMLEGSHQTS